MKLRTIFLFIINFCLAAQISAMDRNISNRLAEMWNQPQLHYAILWNNSEIAQELIKAGADVNQINSNGQTPLFIAAKNGYLGLVKVLLAAGADVNQADEDGATPLWWAAYNGYGDIVKVLLDAQVAINQADDDGISPLALAAQYGHTKIVKVLLAAGACANQANRYGKTPLYAAIIHNRLEVIIALLKTGANISKADLHLTENQVVKAELVKELIKRKLLKVLERHNPLQATIIKDMLKNHAKYSTQLEQLKRRPYIIPEDVKELLVKSRVLSQ